MFQGVRLLLAVAALLFGAQAVLAASRVALVIGNGDYADSTKLANPVNDASDIAAKLRDLGFIVVEGQNLGKRDMEQKIGDFSDRLEGSEAAVFYYAGHGISAGGRNFIVPVDAHLNAPAKLKFESISIDDVVELMKQQSDVNILILDACRNNPFARGNGTSTRGVSESSGGLAAVSSYSGAYTVYSAQDGAVALDGDGRNSPFAIALLKHLGAPGAGVESIMGAVKADVEEMTNGFQSPDAKGLLVRSFSFNPGNVMPKQATRSAAPDDTLEIERIITSRYLNPDADDMAGIVAELYADPATSFGRSYSHGELAAVKSAWFAKYSKWRLQIRPGTFKADFSGPATAEVTFNLDYKYWPKGKGKAPVAGIVGVVLGMVREDGVWKIENEQSAAAQ